MSLIGKSEPRHDALDKVLGKAIFPADLVKPDMLRVKVVFAQRAHAKILNLDTSAAEKYPGVVAVLTHKDVPYNRFGLVEADQPVLCESKVRFFGDRVALVVAQTADAAEEAAHLVRVEYEDLPAVTDALSAMKNDAPLVHDERDSNVLEYVRIRRGDVDEAFKKCDVVLEGEFTTKWQEHAYLQPSAGISYYEDGKLVVETAGQWMHEDRRQIAAIFQLPEDQVVIRYAKIGGAFGGREDLNVAPLLALATWKLKRTTAMIWSRDEDIIAHHKRHPYTMRMKWGARRDGKILAIQNELFADGGAYASTSAEVLKGATLFSSGTYEVENVKSDGYVLYTNNIPCGAFRCFGGPQSQFAAESMVTRLASALDIEPVEMRRRNMYREGGIEPTHHPLPPGVGAIEVLERCELEARTRLGYGSLTMPQSGYVKRGVGFASGIKNVGYSFGYPDRATATVELEGPGEIARAVLRIGAADVGQGAHLILRQICAETLHVPLARVEIVAEDTDKADNAGSASASRMTFMGGRATYDASVAALAAFAAESALRPSGDHGRIRASATKTFAPPATTPIDPVTGEGKPNFCYGFTSQAVEVEVDTRTGQVHVLKIVSAHDVGKAINKQQVEGQIEGCLAQAVGYTLTENMICKDGKILTPYFSNYLLPTTLDMPTEVYPIILEKADPNGPYGARGVAEMPLAPFAAAVACAIYAATGAWVSDLPMTPEVVLKAIRAADGQRSPAPSTP